MKCTRCLGDICWVTELAKITIANKVSVSNWCSAWGKSFPVLQKQAELEYASTDHLCVCLCLCVQLCMCMSNEPQGGIAAVCLLLHSSTLLFLTKQLKVMRILCFAFLKFWAAYFVLLLGSHYLTNKHPFTLAVINCSPHRVQTYLCSCHVIY